MYLHIQTKIKNQKSKIKNQKSKIKNQKSKNKKQKTKNKKQKQTWEKGGESKRGKESKNQYLSQEWFRNEVETRLGYKLQPPRPFHFTDNSDRYLTGYFFTVNYENMTIQKIWMGTGKKRQMALHHVYSEW